MNKKIVIFDWDGTLMDSEAHIVDCLAETFKALDVPAQSPQELKQVIGLGLEQAFHHLLPQASANQVALLSQHYRELFLTRGPSPNTLFPMAREVLNDLRDAGCYLAVATGKSRRGLDKVLAETQLESMFVMTRCADETRSKPHPMMLEEILTDLDSDASDAIMVGDTEFDLQMAATLKMDSIGVSYGVHSVERLESHQPLTILHELAALPDFLRAL